MPIKRMRQFVGWNDTILTDILA